MKNTEEVINNLTDELANLSAKIGSLESFLVSKDYQELTCTQKGLLVEQHTDMKAYKETLLKRLVDLRYQEKREALEDMERRATMQEPANGTPAD